MEKITRRFNWVTGKYFYKMNDQVAFFQSLYHHFNIRHIDYIIHFLDPKIQWANGMEGGYVYGHEGVRTYWAKQFTLVNAKVEPISITAKGNRVMVKIHQVVHDLEGKLLGDQLVDHLFELEGDKIISFHIGISEPNKMDSVANQASDPGFPTNE